MKLACPQKTGGLWKITAVSSTIFGLGLIALSRSRSLVLSIIIMVITGFGMVSIMTSSNTYLQANVEDSKRARVMAFYLFSFFGTVPFGNFITGTIAQGIGVPAAILLAGLCSLLGSAVFAWKYSAYLKKG